MRSVAIAAALAAALVAGRAERAEAIALISPVFRTISFSTYQTVNYSIDPGGISFVAYDAFTPSLSGFNWRIQAVEIDIRQTVQAQVFAAANLVNLGGGVPNFAPQPYSFSVRVAQDVDPLINSSLFPRGFSAVTPNSRILQGTASGAEGLFTTLPQAFDYAVRFDAATDLATGFDVAGNGVYHALRADFLEAAASDKVQTLLNLDFLQQTGGVRPVSGVSFSGGGAWTIRYDGTVDIPAGAPLPPILATPVPPALPLLASALGAMGLIGARRRCKPYAPVCVARPKG